MKTETLSPVRKTWQTILIIALFIALPLVVGWISAAISASSMQLFDQIAKPPFAPPAWLFPVVWTILYILMGLSSYLIYNTGSLNPSLYSQTKRWLMVYGLQLLFNFCWSPVFFNFKWFWFALIWLIALWAMVFWLMTKARSLNRAAFWMLVPYIIWLTIADYLNIGIAILN